MARTLVTGGSGFIATHVIDVLLKAGHSVVTTVRTPQKGQNIRDMHPGVPQSKLDFVIVEDIAQPDAFDQAVVSDPPFEYVFHTASPFHYKYKDAEKELLQPAIIGTTSILRAIKKSAPSVKRVVVTSSLAAVRSKEKNVGGHADWCSVTAEDVKRDPSTGYVASKTLAEQAAWQYMKDEKPSFTLSVINPTLVFGPVAPHSSLSSINTSNERVYTIMTGGAKSGCPPTGTNSLYVDVRDVAIAHLAAAEKSEAAGRRFLLVGGHFTNKQIVEIIAESFPTLKENLPTGEALEKGGEASLVGDYTFSNAQAREVLGIEFTSLKQSLVDTAKSLQALEQSA
ncbi:major facilitator superfamily protein-4 [Coleophoma crateriformis]|uniref:Major facilitator superfamily protein-4 n=1 Tax=Coleophoma crateriformis TaxID=565419 RepID=A0A3D8SBM8_9HELO|nr:major facilitator superfamily protein-4 [Coleophoma crateriformis]